MLHCVHAIRQAASWQTNEQQQKVRAQLTLHVCVQVCRRGVHTVVVAQDQLVPAAAAAPAATTRALKYVFAVLFGATAQA
jgi:intracellular sulfur oxidation DsrE/DsrF family protein